MKVLLNVDYRRITALQVYTKQLIDLSAGVSDDEIALFCIENIVHGLQRQKKIEAMSITDFYEYLHESVFCWHVSLDMLYVVNETVYLFTQLLHEQLKIAMTTVPINFENVISVDEVKCYPSANLIVCNLGVPDDCQIMPNHYQAHRLSSRYM